MMVAGVVLALLPLAAYGLFVLVRTLMGKEVPEAVTIATLAIGLTCFGAGAVMFGVSIWRVFNGV